MGNPIPWQDGNSSGGAFAVLVRPGPPWCLDVQGEGEAFRVPEEKIGTFLIAHAEAIFVCANAGDFHLAFERQLQKQWATRALTCLWGLSRTGRLIDLSIFHDLVADALSGSDLGAMLGKPPAEDRLVLLLEYYRTLQAHAESAINRECIDPLVVEHFGALGIALEVQARVASEQVKHRGLWLAYGARHHLLHACRLRRDELLTVLLSDPSAKALFRLDDNGKPKFDSREIYPRRRQNKDGDVHLQRWLQSALDSLCDMSDLLLPIFANGKVPTMPADLKALHIVHPLVETWIELMEVCRLWKWLGDTEGDELHPELTTRPVLERSDSPLATMCAIGARGPLFRPREKQRFLVLRFKDVGLRALAGILERDYGDSFLADLFRNGTMPVATVASLLSTFNDQSSPGTLTHGQWEHVAQVLLDYLPVGHSVDVMHRILSAAGIPLGVVRLRNVAEYLKEKIIPGLGVYLHYPALDLIEQRLGLPKGGLPKAWECHHRQQPRFDAASFLRTFFKVPPPQYSNRFVIDFLRGCAAQSRWKLPESSEIHMEDLYLELTAHSHVRASGSVRGAATIWESLGKLHLAFADVIRKKTLFELVYNGFAVCAVIGDTYLVEIDASVADLGAIKLTHQIQEAICPAQRELLGNIPGGLDVEIAELFDPRESSQVQ